MLGRGVAETESGTWCDRNVPSTGRPSMNFGPVHPLSDRRTIIGQRGRVVSPSIAGVVLDLVNLLDHLVEGFGHLRMHLLRLVALDEVGRPAVADEQALQLFMGDPREDGRVRRSCSR